jgi:hypothetical protein
MIKFIISLVLVATLSVGIFNNSNGQTKDPIEAAFITMQFYGENWEKNKFMVTIEIDVEDLSDLSFKFFKKYKLVAFTSKDNQIFVVPERFVGRTKEYIVVGCIRYGTDNQMLTTLIPSYPKVYQDRE